MAPSGTAALLQGCQIALSGTFPGHSHAAVERPLLFPMGASLFKTINASTTHLVTTTNDFQKPSVKVTQAQSHDRIHIVSLAWLEECLDQGVRLSEEDYSFDSDIVALPAADAQSRVPRTVQKRPVVLDNSEEEEAKPQPKRKTKAAVVDTTVPDVVATISKPTIPDAKIKARDGETNVAKLSYMKIRVDEACGLQNYTVYIDKESIIYDASLNQTNAGNNNNKFYRVQLLMNNGDYKTWTRWGRVGSRGQSTMLGDGSLRDALRHFEAKFRDKSGLQWQQRGDKPKSGKYTFVERSYTEDTDEEDNAPKLKSESVDVEVPESKLPLAVQDLMALIFNQEYFAATMYDMNYDLNKMPLGKLSKNTITRGYQALKDISELLDDASLAVSLYETAYQDAVESLSNSFYSLIPHAFGMNRPPIIHNNEMLKREVELMDSLSDMKDASILMKKEPKDLEKINALDRQFRGLNLDEMTPLKRESIEFAELKKYLVDTRGATHNANYHVDDIFRIERHGERISLPHSGDRRLLWHGSRATNFGGILSQGLRIAPPEAPVSGYMFGKGIYLADMSSKSANYCAASISNGHALLLLCEAELGAPMQALTDADYDAGEEAKRKGLLSTWGQGMTGPQAWKDAEHINPSLRGIKMPDTRLPTGPTGVPDAYLMYNEYIAYSVEQVRLRYLFRVRM